MPPEPLTKGLLPPDPSPLCPLSSTEFVEPPRTKFLGTPLAETKIFGRLEDLQQLQAIRLTRKDGNFITFSCGL